MNFNNVEEIISKSKEYFNIAEEKTIKMFENYMKKCNYSELEETTENSQINQEEVRLIGISDYDDLKKLFSQRGFYIILTDYVPKQINNCTLSVNIGKYTVKAVYRGECAELRKRVESHIFNTKHNKNNDKPYDICMKLEEGKQGIDIDSEKYKLYKFYIIQHKMKSSLSPQRKCMEKAFDNLFNKPVACKDNN